MTSKVRVLLPPPSCFALTRFAGFASSWIAKQDALRSLGVEGPFDALSRLATLNPGHEDSNFAVIASVSEAIHGAASGKVDCFVARAPRNDGKTCLRDLAGRSAPSFASISRPLQTEGAGNAG